MQKFDTAKINNDVAKQTEDLALELAEGEIRELNPEELELVSGGLEV